MEATELMIGDYLLYNGMPYRVIQISSIDGKSECFYMLENGEEDEGTPIPLTPEILEKNGFKMLNLPDIEGQHQWSCWLDTLTYVTLWCRELYDDAKDGWMIRIESQLATCFIKVEYIHELQHALRLCGIDKEIEL